MSQTLEDLLADPSFVLWIKGECSKEEARRWELWLRKHPERSDVVMEAEEILLAIDQEYAIPDPNKELEQLNREIDQHERLEQLKQIVYSFSGEDQGYRTLARRAAAAAILVATLLGGVLGYHYHEQAQLASEELIEKPQLKEYRTDFGEKLSFRLSDGSKIVLNGNSRLSFSTTAQSGVDSEVRLEGEAYFDIAHLEGGEQRTFSVRTGDGIVRVLGTRFGVNTFGAQTQAVLEEGKVSVQNSSLEAEYELSPGELARFNGDGAKIIIQEVETQIYTSWTEDILTFESTSMDDVVRRIEHTFGVEVVLDPSFEEEALSGSIKSTNLEVLGEALGEVLKAEVMQRDGQLFIGIGPGV